MDTSLILKEAVQVLRDGGVILYPTDTVWGLGCDATNPEAVAKVFAIKHRADSKALVLLASDLDMVARFVREIPSMAIDLVEVNDVPMTLIYPGAIAGKAPVTDPFVAGAPQDDKSVIPNDTLVIPSVAKESINHRQLAYNVVAEDGSVGIRIPMAEFCRQLAFKLGRPLVSTSANISGEPTPQRFTDIPDAIKSACDYVCPPKTDTESTGKASQIIKIGLDGEVEIIRK